MITGDMPGASPVRFSERSTSVKKSKSLQKQFMKKMETLSTTRNIRQTLHELVEIMALCISNNR